MPMSLHLERSLRRFAPAAITGWLRNFFAIAILLLSGMALASSRTKDDVVFMKNGDKITCELISLKQGQLTVKPDYSSNDIILDWTKIDHVESKQEFVV